MIYEGIMFDLDGTLVHTEPEYRYTLVGQTLHTFDRTATEFEIDTFWFRGGRDKFVRNVFGVDVDKFWARFRELDTVEIRAQHTKLYDDISFLQELRDHGKKVGIVTAAPSHVAELELALIGDVDDVVLASESNGILPKPSPDGIYKCLDLLGLKTAPFVGNSDEDVGAAEAAQVPDILIDRGEYDFGITASINITSLYELRDLVGL